MDRQTSSQAGRQASRRATSYDIRNVLFGGIEIRFFHIKSDASQKRKKKDYEKYQANPPFCRKRKKIKTRKDMRKQTLKLELEYPFCSSPLCTQHQCGRWYEKITTDVLKT